MMMLPRGECRMINDGRLDQERGRAPYLAREANRNSLTRPDGDWVQRRDASDCMAEESDEESDDDPSDEGENNLNDWSGSGPSNFFINGSIMDATSGHISNRKPFAIKASVERAPVPGVGPHEKASVGSMTLAAAAGTSPPGLFAGRRIAVSPQDLMRQALVDSLITHPRPLGEASGGLHLDPESLKVVEGIDKLHAYQRQHAVVSQVRTEQKTALANEEGRRIASAISNESRGFQEIARLQNEVNQQAVREAQEIMGEQGIVGIDVNERGRQLFRARLTDDQRLFIQHHPHQPAVRGAFGRRGYDDLVGRPIPSNQLLAASEAVKRLKSNQNITIPGGDLALTAEDAIALKAPEEADLEPAPQSFFGRMLSINAAGRTEEEKAANQSLTHRFFDVLNTLLQPDVMKVVCPPKEQERLMESGAPLRLERAAQILSDARAVALKIRNAQAAQPNVDPLTTRAIVIANYAKTIAARASMVHRAAGDHGELFLNAAGRSLVAAGSAASFAGKATALASVTVGSLVAPAYLAPLVPLLHNSLLYYTVRGVSLAVGGYLGNRRSNDIMREAHEHGDSLQSSAAQWLAHHALDSSVTSLGVFGAAVVVSEIIGESVSEVRGMVGTANLDEVRDVLLGGAFLSLLAEGAVLVPAMFTADYLGSTAASFARAPLSRLVTTLEVAREAVAAFQRASVARTENAEAQTNERRALATAVNVATRAVENSTPKNRAANEQALAQVQEAAAEANRRPLVIDPSKKMLPPPWRRGI
ncbi:MAG: hypothetical protein K2W97_01395 [Chthoniobacterales bacterium]|nr:hypothetical protein [Chthoniobacterales bacterium]